MFASLAIGLVSVELLAQAAGRGGKGGWPWALPFAALVVLLPAVVFAVTLRLAARGGLRLSPRAAVASAALLGALTPAVLFAVKPLLHWLPIGGDLFSGLAVSQLCMAVFSIAVATGLAALWRAH
jgi:hypothetical protein